MEYMRARLAEWEGVCVLDLLLGQVQAFRGDVREIKIIKQKFIP